MSPVTEPQSPTATNVVELAISGMTCASCASRIERKPNKLDGVTATVNYATEKAKVVFEPSVTTEDLVGAVAAAGYGAALPTPPDQGGGATARADGAARRGRPEGNQAAGAAAGGGTR